MVRRHDLTLARVRRQQHRTWQATAHDRILRRGSGCPVIEEDAAMCRRSKRMRIANGERQMVRPRLRLAIGRSPFAAVLVGALLAVGSPAAAQDYPARPIELVGPFPPRRGGAPGAR